MKKLILIRHGQTDWNLAKRWQGHADIALNAEGLRQAEAVAARLAYWEIDAIYSSDLLRARVSAEKIATPHALPITLDTVWRERDVGRFSGLTYDALSVTHKQQYAAMKRGELPESGGEDNTQLQARIAPACDALLSQHPEQTVLLISHGGTISVIMHHILGLEESVFRIKGNTCISCINFDQYGRPQLTLLNDTAHLEPFAHK